MSESQPPAPRESDIVLPKKHTGFFSRIVKYAFARATGLGLMLVIGMFVAVIVLNFGGYIDDIYQANIDDIIMFMSYNGEFRDMSQQEYLQAVADYRWQLEERYGLHTPFLVRCARWTYQALVLNIGSYEVQETRFFFLPNAPSETIKMIFLNRLPYTLLLFGVSNLLFFFASLFTALFLFNRYESFLDRLFVFLSPISSIPNWVYGVFLVIIFAAVLRVLPFPKRLTEGIGWYMAANPLYFLKYMILPVAAIFLNMFFQSVYSWRTFFLLQAGEDFIELAKAKGLSDKVIQRRYLIRPTLPYIITNFAMTMLGIWQAAFILEKFFFWPGIGSLFFDSIGQPQITIGVIVVFAYLLVITVFLLDIIYALVDPRVRVGAGGNGGTMAGASEQRLLRRLKRFFTIRPRLKVDRPATRLTPLPAEEFTPLSRAALRRNQFSAFRSALREIRRYPSAIFGLAIIGLLVLVSIYTVIAYPYKETIIRWRGDGNIWVNNPEFAQPVWSNFFRTEKLPETIILDSRDGTVFKEVEPAGTGMNQVTILFPIEYPYDAYPQDLVVNVSTVNGESAPYVMLTWITPDGREVPLDTFISTSEHRYSFEWQYYNDRQSLLETRSGPPPWENLFVQNGAFGGEVLRGTYQLRLDGFVFGEDADLDAEVVLYGQVYGLAGTDDVRRDLILALLWGTPFSLAFGLLGAFGTGLLAMGLAAMAVWFGGWVDGLIQRITEINMLLPALPIAIMIYFVYTHNLWVILGVIILLSVFGNALKNYRAAFLQFKEAGYIQAAQVYGAGNFRLILKYLVPRIIPLLVPQLVALVPSYIFLEPTLAFVGVADPHLPTWGKVLMTGLYVTEQDNQIFYLTLMHNPYLALEPLALMFITGLAFSLLGMALDRIFNPRLRSL